MVFEFFMFQKNWNLEYVTLTEYLLVLDHLHKFFLFSNP